MNYDEKSIKKRIAEIIESNSSELIELAQEIHANPELGYEENFACKKQVELLEKLGFTVETPFAGIDTSFKTSHSSDAPVIAILSEYDALPKLGHACGHNLIAGVSMGAGIAAIELLKETGCTGTVVLMGTPAEECGGGKIKILNIGAFKDINASIIAHPAGKTRMDTGSLGVKRYQVAFHGQSAHAAGSPEKGKNSLDAVMLLFAGVNAWRQHLPEDTRVHGIVSSGGEKPNIVPDYASCDFYLRANDNETQDKMEERFKAIAQGAALMTETKAEIGSVAEHYTARKINFTFNDEYIAVAGELGMNPDPTKKPGRGSSDFGNVSQVVPGAHVYFGITDDETPLHSPEFEKAANSDKGYERMLLTAQAIAWVAFKYLADEKFRKSVDDEFAL